MSGPKFTPGPWKVYRTKSGDVLGIGDAKAGGVTDYQGGFWRSGKEKLANINLVAAAPELYEALASILSAINFVNAIPGPKGKALRAKAGIALAKARGESLLAEQEDAK